jgi:hypothetical protein
MWNLGDEEKTWMRGIVDRALSVFIEADNNYVAIIPDAECPPRADVADAL